MWVRHLQVVSFRNWAQADLALRPGPVVLVGRNGEGKTNLVEAVAYLATMSSHRVATDAPLVRHGADQAVVRAALRRGDRELLVELEINPGRANRVRVNRAPLQRPRDLLGLVRTVLFAPEDLALVRGDPTERRRFLDELLVTRTPRLAGVRSDYERVLKQRNALLKTARMARGRAIETLDAWDGHLVALGGELLAARLRLVADLAPHLASAYAAVAGKGAVTATLGYASTVPAAGDGSPLPSRGPSGAAPVPALPDADAVPDADVLPDADAVPDADALAAALRDQLAERRADELDRGVTLVGPHRDDLVIHLGPGPAKGFASHGESWSLALGLKLATFALLRADGEDPILILDDVFATLDAGRRAALAAVARSAEQTLVTAAVLDDVPEELRGVRVEVGGGAVTVRDGTASDGGGSDGSVAPSSAAGAPGGAPAEEGR